GAGCILIGLVAAFIGAPLGTAQGQSDLTNALAVVVGGGIVSTIAAWAIVRALPRSRLASAAVLHATSGDTGEAGAAADAGALPSTGAPVRIAPVPTIRAGQVGIVVTPLRPVGKALFESSLIEVQSVGDYVDEGKHVVVVRASAYAVEVEERPA
ncbi:MAG: NfeD family protein, partial [Phycisphaerae bacterium]|nr:NfeD family protein [Phycisphaerae bacterium]